ncbi:DUF5686 and carboxypeptidase regulatory-like domain-containing protein [Polluticoccus soli]|uniref:DUF5686 and carboxypeptidase regulatory-like domain-containing protein n=1 Tax=Polluticoccus soli TaxID=3034150 RepID=UPI0023E32212|nr:DUF5686 and carboxypeptidase regulatory-like domain-containing protein [Flavipsychrobacter sp. JY13-12]
MKRQHLYSLFLLLATISSLPVFAGVLKGKVSDDKGEPLLFATVFVQGTTMGTTTNAEAQYQLQLAPGTHKVLCQYMGFKQASFTVTIKGDETISHDFQLQDLALEMKTVVIKANAEDPAYAIIRKAIKKREFHLEQVKSFQTSAYLKTVLRNRAMPTSIPGLMSKKEGKEAKSEMGFDSSGKGIWMLAEQEADYYAANGKERTIIRSVRQSGDPNGFGMSQLPPVITFYENNACQWQGIAPRGFVSPISDNALHYYTYKYQGEFREGNHTINKIEVTPKRDYEPLLKGTLYIVEDDWAIHSLDLMATTKSNLEFFDTLRFQQVFLPMKKDTWVIKNQVMYLTLKFFGLDITGYMATVYDKQKVNEPVPDTVFNDKIISIYEKDANKKDTSYWADKRPIPLESDEVHDYTVKDSILVLQNDPVRNDSIRRKGNRFHLGDILRGGYEYNSRKNKHEFATNSLLSFDLVNYNTVEGVNVSPKFSWKYNIDTGKSLQTNLYTRYGFSNEHFNALGRTVYTTNQRDWKGRYWQIGAEGGKYVYQYNPQSTLKPLYNTVSTLLRARNHMKIYERWNGAVFVERHYGNGFRWYAKMDYQHRLPLENTTSFSWSDEKLTSNVPDELAWVKWEEHNAALATVWLAYRPGTTYTLYPTYKQPHGSNWPLFSIWYQKGIAGVFDSKTDFDKWRFSVEDDMNLKLLGSMSYTASVGGFLNDKYVSLPDLMHLADNEVFVAAPYLKSFQLAPYYQYSNTAKLYGELHLEYYLKGLLTNKIPLLRQAKWYLVLGTNTFYAGTNSYYTEAFAGIDNLGFKAYRFLRVDVVHSWDQMNRQMTGIRIGLSLLGVPISISGGSAAEM